MPQMTPDEMELAVRRITDEVTVSVRASLFKLYAIVGSAVVAAVGFTAWDIYKTSVEAAAQQVVTATKGTTDAASAKLAELNIKMGIASSLEEKAQKKLDDVDDVLTKARPKLDIIDQTVGRLDQIGRDVDNTTAQVERAKATVESFPQLSQQVIDLGKHLDQIDKILAELTSSSTAAGVRISSSPPAPTAVVADTQAIQRKVVAAAEQPLVFLQYNAMPDEVAESIRKGLQDFGFVTPAKQKVAMASTGEFSVRYFYPGDVPAAKSLAESAQQLLTHLGIKAPPIAVTDLTNWPYKKPSPNTLELWIGLAAAAPG